MAVLVNLVDKELILSQVDSNYSFLLVLQLNKVMPLSFALLSLFRTRLKVVLLNIGASPVVLFSIVHINIEFDDLLGSLLNYCFHQSALLLKFRRLLEYMDEFDFWDHLL